MTATKVIDTIIEHDQFEAVGRQGRVCISGARVQNWVALKLVAHFGILTKICILVAPSIGKDFSGNVPATFIGLGTGDLVKSAKSMHPPRDG
jgi:hypothetical protein